MAYNPRKRMISPHIWGSVDFETILVRTEEAAAGLFFIGLFSLADDMGIVEYDPERLGLRILRGLYIKHKSNIPQWIDEYLNLNMVDKFTHKNGEERNYLMLPGWFDFQRVPHPKLSEQPLPSFELLDKYPGYEEGLCGSIQTFIKENQTNGVKCPNFNREYATRLSIHSDIYGVMFESEMQIKPNQSKSNENKSIMSDSAPSNGEMDTDQFKQFWKSYPRKIKKKDAIKAFKDLNPDNELLELILGDIEEKKKTPQWKSSLRKDNGQYIPLPGSYIRDERWADEKTQVPKPGESWKD